jgi:hypothetical protein
MYLRKEKGVLELLDNDVEKPISIFEKDEPQDAKSLILAAGFESLDLLIAIDALPAHHKIVFNLYVFEEFTHKEIGQKLNISAGTSKSHLARARKKIQKILAEKAVAMKKKNKRAGLLPFFGLKKKEDAYGEDMFREKLGDGAFPPLGNLPVSLQVVLTTTAPTSATASGCGLGVKGFLLSSTVTIALTTVAVFSFSKSSTNENFIVNEDVAEFSEVGTPEISKSSETLIVPDTTSILFDEEETITQVKEVKVKKPKVKKEETIVNQTSKLQKLPPVVIKKNVIVRDTVFEIIEK